MANNGNTLLMLKASVSARRARQSDRAGAMGPLALSGDGRLVLRLGDKLKCWSLLP